MSRFDNRTKEVNTRYAIDLIDEEAPVAVKDRFIYCEGGDGPLGHPVSSLTLTSLVIMLVDTVDFGSSRIINMDTINA